MEQELVKTNECLRVGDDDASVEDWAALLEAIDDCRAC